jgi:hypothetical protein
MSEKENTYFFSPNMMWLKVFGPWFNYLGSFLSRSGKPLWKIRPVDGSLIPELKGRMELTHLTSGEQI